MPLLAKKPIKKLPSGWPSRGMIRADVNDFIVIAHADRTPHYSTDGINWKQIDLNVPAENQICSQFERQRWAK